jgi:hypothetical protein
MRHKSVVVERKNGSVLQATYRLGWTYKVYLESRMLKGIVHTWAAGQQAM